MQNSNQKTGLFGLEGAKQATKIQKFNTKLQNYDTSGLKLLPLKTAKPGRIYDDAINCRESSLDRNSQTPLTKKTYNKSNLINIDVFKNKISKLSSRHKYYQLISNISLVIDGLYNFFICEGAHGAGKTTLIKSILESKELVENVDYVRVTGVMSTLAMYNLLEQYKKDKIIILDDVVNSIKEERAVEILKAATDDKKIRTIQYRTTKGQVEEEFEFNSSVIVFTNNPISKKHAALKDRGFFQKLHLSTNEKLEYIKEFFINANLEYANEATTEQRLYVLNCLHRMVDNGYTEFTCRTYIQLLVKFIADEQAFEAVVSEICKLTNESRLRMIMHKYQGEKSRWLELFKEQTGKSQSTYQKTLKRIKEDMDLQTYKSLANNNELLRKEIRNGSKN